MRRIKLLWLLTITANCFLTLSCSSWKTIDDPKWGFRIDVPSILQDKNFEGKDLWVHENAQMRVIVDFGKVPSQAELSLKRDFKQTVTQVNGYNAVIFTYHEQSNPKKQQFNKAAALVFQESPKSYGEGKPPVFRVEYVSESDMETALKILQTVRFYES
jgi:hypothetical protein